PADPGDRAPRAASPRGRARRGPPRHRPRARPRPLARLPADLRTGGDPMSDLDLWGRLRPGDWLDAQVFPPLGYAVPGIIPEGFGLLAAPPKAGKSWFALGVLLDVARGARTLGGVDTGPARPVLYMALEDGDRRLQGRART